VRGRAPSLHAPSVGDPERFHDQRSSGSAVSKLGLALHRG
jgi:hypothetical protein